MYKLSTPSLSPRSFTKNVLLITYYFLLKNVILKNVILKNVILKNVILNT